MTPAVLPPSGLSLHIISEVCGHTSDPSGVPAPWIASEAARLHKRTYTYIYVYIHIYIYVDIQFLCLHNPRVFSIQWVKFAYHFSGVRPCERPSGVSAPWIAIVVARIHKRLYHKHV